MCDKSVKTVERESVKQTSKLNHSRPNIALPMHQDTTHEKEVNILSIWAKHSEIHHQNTASSLTIQRVSGMFVFLFKECLFSSSKDIFLF